MYTVCMPTIYIFRNIRIVIFTNDHGPPHIHAISPDGEAKIKLDNLECYFLRGFTEKDLKRITGFLKNKQEYLIEVWDEIHK